MFTRAAARDYLTTEFYGTLVPYVLRAGFFALVGWALKKVCRGDLQAAVISGQAGQEN